MPWHVLPEETGIIAIHAALLPTGDILFFGDWKDLIANNDLAPLTWSGLFRFANESVSLFEAGEIPDTNCFCGGQSFLADGRLLVAGGTRKRLPGDPPPEEDDEHQHGNMFGGGERGCWLYEPRGERWTQVANLNLDPIGSVRSGGRWYPSVVTLGDGQAFAVGGHPDVREHYPPDFSYEDMRHNNNTPERYSPGGNSWEHLLEDLTAPNGNGVITDSYPRFHLMPNGRLFSVTAGNGLKRSFNPYSGKWEDPDVDESDLPSSYDRGSAATSVLLPLLPPLYRPRILTCNRENAYRIDVDVESPTWVQADNRMGTAAGLVRSSGCVVLLPTGSVFVSGGVRAPNEDEGNANVPVFEPELYDPGIDWDAGNFSGNERWETIDEPAEVQRGYHSVALLLPDGRVWTAGSTENDDNGDDTAETRIEVFEPYYFNEPGRPQITSCPTDVSYGRNFIVQTPQAASIQRVALIRCGSVTHAFDSDQRYVGLQFNEIQQGVLQVTAPPSGNIAPPGYYMLWIIDDHMIGDKQGRPCQLASFIRVGHQTCYITPNVSTYSRQEVEALGTPGANLAEAFHVVYEGFLPHEVYPPVITLRRPDNTAVPGMKVQYDSVDYEAGVQEKDTSQHIVYTYNVIFDSTEAFDDIPAQDDSQLVTLRAEMATHICVTNLVLSKNPNPRMSDGDPPWLSIDLRVFKTKPGESFSAGVSHGSGGDAPFDYIQSLLAEYNSLPADDAHPFLQLPMSQETNRLALYSEDDEGDPVYNYAVAKVRYRAPEGIDADDVRVFFRLCSTGWTGLEYDVTATYRRHGEGATAVPLLGLAGGEITYIPCFAEPRSDNMEEQEDSTNRRTLGGAGVQEVHGYFGCWLDMNQDVPRFPLEPDGNGPFEGDLLSIQELMRGLHQCLVAEIHYPPDPILNGATPGSSDNLAQRNILLDETDNPGGFSTHLVHHTFEIKPSPVSLQAVAQGVSTSATSSLAPDELIVDWGNLPRDTHVTLYLPDVDTDEILAAAAARQGPPNLTRAGAHTLRCRVTDVGFIPVPGARSKNIPGLMTFQLPPNLTKGQKFTVVVRQMQGRTRRIMGAFQFDIIVSTAKEILPRARRNLSVLRHIAQAIPKHNRWYPVFKRYLEELADRVRGLGGNPDEIAPSPTGSGRLPKADRPGDEPQSYTGKICQIIYDCFGDFEGFVLEGCLDRHVFECRERAMEALVSKACCERIRVTVYTHSNNRRKVFRIALHC